MTSINEHLHCNPHGTHAGSRNDFIKLSFLPLSSVDGNYLLSCGSDKSLKLWSVKQGTLLKTYTGHGYEVLDADRWLENVEITKEKQTQLILSPNTVRNHICFNSSYDSSQVCSCSSDKTVILWDVGSGNVTRKFRGHAGVRTSYFNFVICQIYFNFRLSTFPTGFISVILLPQKVNCVQFNEDASVILSGQTQPLLNTQSSFEK